MAGLDPAINDRTIADLSGTDGRIKSGHDG
jgi:hypothetical protein